MDLSVRDRYVNSAHDTWCLAARSVIVPSQWIAAKATLGSKSDNRLCGHAILAGTSRERKSRLKALCENLGTTSIQYSLSALSCNLLTIS